MLQTTSASLIPPLTNYLKSCQLKVDSGTTYEERMSLAKKFWNSLSRSSNPSFSPIRELLGQMQGSLQRCAYCEDSLGHQIEHVYPKTLFPSQVFNWDNFLHACGSCNGAKLAQFSIFLNTGGILELNSRKPPTDEPLASNSLLIDPRIENPLDFMILDLCDTFHFVPTGYFENRAQYTIETLQLNLRSGLVESRRTALALYKSSFKEYDIAKNNNEPIDKLSMIARRISSEMSHRTIWEEIKRQYLKASWLVEFKQLFANHPEALNW